METFKLFIAPLLIGCIIIEAYLSAKDNSGNYEKKDTITNLVIFAISFSLNVLIKGSVYVVFSWIHEHSLFNIGTGTLAWFVLFFLSDLQAYSFHLLGHKSRFFWAMHVIHHSSEKYNLTTAIRTPLTNTGFRFTALAPLVFLGFAPVMVITIDTFILLYSFFQHTEFVKKLGWFEYIFNTPSHHRVHHASDEKYIDKNFGSVLIVWDKLFGTFKEEEEHPTYGLTKPLKKSTLLNIIFHEWIAIFDDIRQMPIGVNMIKMIFGRPGISKPSKADERQVYKITSLTKAIYAIVGVLLLIPSNSYAQDGRTYLLLGIDAEKRHQHRTALTYYKRVIELEPNPTEALSRASRLLCTLAGREQNKSLKIVKADSANMYATRALQLNANLKEARLSLIISFGLLSEASPSPAQKFRNAMRIRKEAETLLAMDSLFAPAYYILGKWHYEVSKLTWIEKFACNAFLAKIPNDVSYGKSLSYYEKAIGIQPEYILFHYAKAGTLYEQRRYHEVIAVLNNAIKLPCTEPDDLVRKEKCLKLLYEAKRNVGIVAGLF